MLCECVYNCIVRVLCVCVLYVCCVVLCVCVVLTCVCVIETDRVRGWVCSLYTVLSY